jgi:hypothetical protein
VVSVTVFDPSAFVMVVVCTVVNVPSGLTDFVSTCCPTAVASMAAAAAAAVGTAISEITGTGALENGSGFFCKARVAKPEIHHKMDAKMHKIPAVPIEQSNALLQKSEAMATCE